MDIQLIVFMGISLAFILPIVGYIVHRIDRRDKIKVNAGTKLYIKNSRNSPIYMLHRILSRSSFTRGYLDKISRRYEILYPGEPKRIALNTMKVTILAWSLCLVELFVLYFQKPNLHNGILALYLVFVINNEVINRQIASTEIKLLEQMSIFISDVSHNYHINRMVDDAILASMDGLGYEMKIHASRLYEIVTSNNLKEDVIKYNTTIHNRYLKMFLSLCISVMEFNDKKVNGQLLFTTNLRHLIREINIEVLKLKKLKYLFTGTVFVTVAVCIPIDAIHSFGISLVPELEDFYTGKGGILFVGAIILSSVMVYLLVNNLKEMKRVLPKSYHYLKKLEKTRIIRKALDNYVEKNYGRVLVLKNTLKRVGETISPRQLLLKRMMVGLLTFCLSIGMIFFIHYKNKQNIVGKVNNIMSVTSVSNQTQLTLITEAILGYTKGYKAEAVSEEFLLQEITKDNTFYQSKIREEIAGEVVRRITGYQSEYFKWYELIIALGISITGFYVPYWLILYKKRILRMIMEDEVNQFNSIIFMMMYIDHTTVIDLLQQMELFAFVYKKPIQECINDYNSGDIEALTRLKENENYGPFRRLVDNLIRCDTIPIEKAFSEIASDRENYHDRRKQENEISVQKRADLAKPLSFIPAVLVTIYLLLPLLIASLKELEGFKESLSSMGF